MAEEQAKEPAVEIEDAELKQELALAMKTLRDERKAKEKGETPPEVSGGVIRKDPEGVSAIDKNQAVDRDQDTPFGKGVAIDVKPEPNRKFCLAYAIKGAAGLGWKGAELEERWVKACYGGDWNEMARISPSSITKTTLEADDDSLGGFLVPDEWRQEIMPMLKARAVFRAAGATILPDAGMVTHLPTQQSAVTIRRIGMGAQSSAITQSEPTFGSKQLTLKRYAARALIDEDLLALSPHAVEALVRKDIVEEMALAQDNDCWSGVGADRIRGILYDAALTNTHSSIGALSLTTHVKGALDTMAARNAAGNLNGILMHPTTYGYVTNKVDGIARSLLFESYNQAYFGRQIFGLPVYTSTQITSGYMLIGNFREFFIAEGGAMRIKVLREAYADQLQIGIVASLKVDALARQISEFELLSGITS